MGGSPAIIKGGRYEIVADPVKRHIFFERVFDPLLELSAQYPDSIYAWELINEPEWAIRKLSPFGKTGGNRKVSLTEMRQFIAEGILRINGRPLPDGRGAFKSSVGFAHWNSMDEWDSSELGITLHQFHYYAQGNRNLPPHLYPEDIPCIVGEFATAQSRAWPDLKSLHKDQGVANRLRCVEEKGYPACFMWSAGAVDVAANWTANERRELMAYMSSSRRDTLA